MESDDLLNARPLPLGMGSGPAWQLRPLQNCSYQEFRDPADLHTAYTSKAQCREFVSLDACFAVGAQVPMRLGLDDQIHRVVATLIQPELLSEEAGDLGRLRERKRLGCTPKQWIREQRLALALEQLQAEGPRPKINSVALGCGYLSPAHFDRDFKQRCGITPLQAGRA